MKLLFLWVNCSKNKFIEKKGFNISGEYYWKYDEEKKVLFSKKKAGYIKNFWNESNDNIEDLSIIVGTNGSGKTTLLSEIMEFNSVLKYSANPDLLMSQEKKIVVYENNGHIYYDHNLNNEIETKPFVKKRAMDSSDYCTNIFVSNSMETSVNGVGYNTNGVLKFALTDLTISGQAKMLLNVNKIPEYIYPSAENDLSRYYDDPETHREENRSINKIKELNDLIHIDGSAYEDINALIKLFFLVYSSSDKYMGKRYSTVNLHIRTTGELFDSETIMDEATGYGIFREIQATKVEDNKLLFNKLATYYFFELKNYYGDFITEDIEVLDIKAIETIKKSLEDIVSRKGIDNLRENMTVDEYFLNAAYDLLLFNQVVNENKIISDKVSEDSPISYEFLQVDLDKNKEFWNRLFLFFKRKISSFLLRYLRFDFEQDSSGEEALLKLYSRIFWIDNAQGCQRNNLILIDEIDLYMHPKWQRNLVNCLVEDIENLIGRNNKAQIIITTHSPIFLSDIPKANILFLKNEEGRCEVDGNVKHCNSFGNNVHTLFLDSFFLDEEGTMGAFAEKKINSILKLLRSGEKINDEDKQILRVINCIGDDLIRNKLLEMYEKNQGLQHQLKEKQTPAENMAIDNTIAMLKSQVKELLRTIEQLEQMKND